MDQPQSIQFRRRIYMRPVDLTPMVDLGFILITFFVFTSTMSQATAMKLFLPADKKSDSMLVRASSAITLLPAQENKVFYYFGQLTTSTRMEHCNTSDLRNMLIQWIEARAGGEMVAVIRPHESGTFGNLINVLDELTITSVKSYALAEITEQERQLITQENSERRASKFP